MKNNNELLIVWGTGEKATLLMGFIEKYNILHQSIFESRMIDVDFFLDSNSEKQKSLFFYQSVKSPKDIKWDFKKLYCVVAIADDKIVKAKLENLNGVEGKNFIGYIEFLQEMNLEFINRLQKNKILPINFDDRIIDEGCSIEKLVEENTIKKLSCEGKRILREAIAIYIIKKWKYSSDKLTLFKKIKGRFSDSVIISACAYVFRNQIDMLADFFGKNLMPFNRKKNIKIIGIYDERYYNGGGQKFLSLIMPIYINMGYNIVFFTDEYKENGEYNLPQGVIRVNLTNKYEKDLQSRYEEFLYYIKEYNIDIMCYHNRFAEEEFFYDLLFFKMQGVFVLAELHLFFMMLINIKNGLADKLYKIYRLADAIIVLSKTDQVFWENLGVNAVYIPNPIEWQDTMLRISNKSRESHTILWIGRIEQSGKRVFDIIKIMIEVVKKLPDVKLQLVGSTNDENLLKMLNKLIDENNLECNINLCGYHNEVGAFYRNSDVMLMTSEMEAFPLVIAESKMNGLPLVLYDLPYIELLADGKGYVSVPQGDYKSAAREILKILGDEEMRNRMSEDAKASIKPFCSYNIEGAWRNIFDGVVAHSNEAVIDENYMYNIEQLLLNYIWKMENIK